MELSLSNCFYPFFLYLAGRARIIEMINQCILRILCWGGCAVYRWHSALNHYSQDQTTNFFPFQVYENFTCNFSSYNPHLENLSSALTVSAKVDCCLCPNVHLFDIYCSRPLSLPELGQAPSSVEDLKKGEPFKTRLSCHFGQHSCQKKWEEVMGVTAQLI